MQWDGQAACCGVPACCLAGLHYGLDAGGARAPGRPAHAKYLLLGQGLQQRSLRRKRVRGVPGHALGAVVLVVLVGGVGVRAKAEGGGVLAEVLEGVDAHQPRGGHAPPREVLLCGEEAVAEDGQQDLGFGHHLEERLNRLNIATQPGVHKAGVDARGPPLVLNALILTAPWYSKD